MPVEPRGVAGSLTLAAAGRGAEAAREGLALRSSLRPGLLPRILVEEVLREAGGGPGEGEPRLSSAP